MLLCTLRKWRTLSQMNLQSFQLFHSSKSCERVLKISCIEPAPSILSKKTLHQTGNWLSGLECRRYASDDKYRVHNPFSSDVDDEEDKTTEMVKRKPAGFFSSLFQVWRTPAPALVTGLAGLIPFVAAPSYLYFFSNSFHPFIISAQLAYGAVILSFVGGIRWGFVMPYRHGSTHMVTWRSILQSVVPSVIAWGGLLLPDLTGGLLMVGSGMLLALYNDLRLFGDYPKWMMGLRCLLTVVAVTTLIASVILVEENRLNNLTKKRAQNKLLDKDV